jgi:hypothetical protein
MTDKDYTLYREKLNTLLWAERVIKKHIGLYNTIIEFNNGIDIPFKQMVFNFFNNISSIPICEFCGVDKVKFQNNSYNKYCSVKCSSNDNNEKRIESSKKTLLSKYGTTSAFMVNIEKTKEKNIEKWGVDNPSKSNIIKEKIKNTHRSKDSESIKKSNDKRKKTVVDKYGIENISQLDKIQEKIVKTNLNKYGVNYPLLNKEISEKRHATFLKKWGGHPLSNENLIKERSDARRKTMFHKWVSIIESNISDKYKIEHLDSNRNIKISCSECNNIVDVSKDLLKSRDKEYLCIECFPKRSLNFKRNKLTLDKYNILDIQDSEILSYNNLIFKCNHISCNHEFEINRKNLYDRHFDGCSIICTVCNPIGLGDSSHQLDISNFLKTNNIDYLYGDRQILSGKELDIYIPSHKLAIEFNGIYWHSEYFKDRYYHLNKSIDCKSQDISLLHIFEDDWINRKDIVKSIILNKLNISSEKIYARKCKISFDIPVSDAKDFLNNNHIQGHSNSTYKIGLYHNDELVSLMTFGYRKTNSKKEFELIRFCNKINTNVIGAASKLFSNFIKNIPIDVNRIISYSDMAHFDGNLYKVLGFDYCHLSKPNYFWVVDGIRKHRFTYNKKKLVKQGFDPNKTEVEIMHELGHYRIYGCGQVRWEYYLKR